MPRFVAQNSCVSKFIYQDFDQTNRPLVWVGCRSKLGITKGASYYRTLGSGVRSKTPQALFQHWRNICLTCTVS